MRRVSSVVTLAVAAAVVVSCSSPPAGSPDPSLTESLDGTYWHGSVGPSGAMYEFHASGGRLTGFAHQIVEGRQRAVSAITDVSFDGAAIEMRFAGIPPYVGEVDLDAGRIEGGHPNAGAYEDVDLTRVDPADWPVVVAKPLPAAGEPAYAWTRPAEREDGWPTATPEEAGIDRAAIEQTVTAIMGGDAGWLHSLLIARGGNLVVEEYFYGWGADDLHRVASVTKSISSLLVGIAIDRGDLAGVDVPLLDFFPTRRALAGDGWENLTLEHLLTMSMGLDWSAQEAEQFAAPGEDRFADVLARNVRDEPGTRFQYVSRNTNLLSMVLLRATDSHADAFAAEHLFGPLGIRTWDWENNRYEGHPGMSGTLMLRPRDMAKIGQLVLNEGSWEGRQVVSADWIRESTAKRFSPEGDDEYGYLWWGFDDPPPGVDFANGLGSQFIFVVPAFDMVVVTTGANDYSLGKHMAFLQVAERHLIPGLH